MKKTNQFLAWCLMTCATSIAAAQDSNPPSVGGELMYESKTIVSNAQNSKVHSTLVAAVKAADLITTLNSAGPFTVFAPVDDAFENLPAGTVESLLKPENKVNLTRILTYHVLPGNLTFNELSSAIKKQNGKVMMKSVAGEMLTFSMNGPRNIMVTDANGGKANITVYDVMQSNGVIHVIDAVLIPD
jgi:uncharacterized surface protein with fasciclin (FAS1) repeats